MLRAHACSAGAAHTAQEVKSTAAVGAAPCIVGARIQRTGQRIGIGDEGCTAASCGRQWNCPAHLPSAQLGLSWHLTQPGQQFRARQTGRQAGGPRGWRLAAQACAPPDCFLGGERQAAQYNWNGTQSGQCTRVPRLLSQPWRSAARPRHRRRHLAERAECAILVYAPSAAMAQQSACTAATPVGRPVVGVSNNQRPRGRVPTAARLLVPSTCMKLSSLFSCSLFVSAALVHRTGCSYQECSQLAPVGETPNMASSAAAADPNLELKLEEGCLEEPSSPGESDEDEAAVVRHGELGRKAR